MRTFWKKCAHETGRCRDGGSRLGRTLGRLEGGCESWVPASTLRYGWSPLSAGGSTCKRDGVRRSFYSSKPGRNGQREANRKADAWLDDGIEDQRMKVGTAYLKFLEGKRQTTSRSNWAPMMSRWNNHISSVIARKQVSALTEQDLQDVLESSLRAVPNCPERH